MGAGSGGRDAGGGGADGTLCTQRLWVGVGREAADPQSAVCEGQQRPSGDSCKHLCMWILQGVWVSKAEHEPGSLELRGLGVLGPRGLGAKPFTQQWVGVGVNECIPFAC